MQLKKNRSCKESVRQQVLKRPVTFMKLVSETQCATETVEKYLSEFLKETLVKEKKGKFRIIYSTNVTTEHVEFYELLLNPTIKSTIICMLKLDKPVLQIELVAITEKSNPSISRGLKLLLDKRFINRNYHAPFSTYEIIDKNKIMSLLHYTYPEIYHNFDKFELNEPEMIKIFLDIHK